MKRKTERGEGKLSGIFALALIAAVAYAGWNVAPVYIDHYSFTDKVVEICRTPKYKAADDELYRMLLKEVDERRLDPWISRENFDIRTTERGRIITLDYERDAKILPGWTKKFKFSFKADQPLI
jgi:hypothetical protein